MCVILCTSAIYMYVNKKSPYSNSNYVMIAFYMCLMYMCVYI